VLLKHGDGEYRLVAEDRDGNVTVVQTDYEAELVAKYDDIFPKVSLENPSVSDLVAELHTFNLNPDGLQRVSIPMTPDTSMVKAIRTAAQIVTRANERDTFYLSSRAWLYRSKEYMSIALYVTGKIDTDRIEEAFKKAILPPDLLTTADRVEWSRQTQRLGATIGPILSELEPEKREWVKII